METITHVVRPIENGEFEIYPSIQWMHSISVFVAQTLDIPSHKIDVKVHHTIKQECVYVCVIYKIKYKS